MTFKMFSPELGTEHILSDSFSLIVITELLLQL